MHSRRRAREPKESGGLLREAEPVRFTFIAAKRAEHNVSILCRCLEVTRSGLPLQLRCRHSRGRDPGFSEGFPPDFPRCVSGLSVPQRRDAGPATHRRSPPSPRPDRSPIRRRQTDATWHRARRRRGGRAPSESRLVAVPANHSRSTSLTSGRSELPRIHRRVEFGLTNADQPRLPFVDKRQTRVTSNVCAFLASSESSASTLVSASFVAILERNVLSDRRRSSAEPCTRRRSRSLRSSPPRRL